MDSKLSTKRTTMLVLRAQAGDRDAADRLLETIQGELFGYLLKMLNDRADAEDVLQASLLQAVKKLKWLREPEHFRAWIFRIASRQGFRIIKRRQKRVEFSNVEFLDAVAPAEITEPEHQDLIQRIPEWLERLTPNGREALMLHYLMGFTTAQVADILGIPLGTAKSRISYSLACIRKHVTNFGG